MPVDTITVQTTIEGLDFGLDASNRPVSRLADGKQYGVVLHNPATGDLIGANGALVSGAGNGTAVPTKIFGIGNGGSAIGAGTTPTTQHPADFTEFIGVTLGYSNQSASTITVTKAVAYPTAIHEDATQPAAADLKNVTFGGNASGVVPVSPGGAGTDTRSAWKFSDFIPMKSKVRTDDTTKMPLVQVRSHFAAAGNGVSLAAGEITAWNGGPAAFGRQYAARIPAGDTTGTWSGATGPLAAGTFIVPTIVIFHYPVDVRCIFTGGNSNTKGHLTTGGASGWPAFAGGLLRQSGKRYAFNNLAFTGQTTAGSHLILKDAILECANQGQTTPYATVFFGWSPNDLSAAATAASTTVPALSDALSQATFDDGYARALEMGNWLEKKGVKPQIAGNGAWNTMNASQHNMRRANNARLQALCASRGWTFHNFASVIDNPANQNQILPAYNQGDDLHYTDSCHAALGALVAAAQS